MRKMATIQRVAEVKAIPGADKITAYRVGGWWVVDAVGKYVPGDPVVYCEVDSWIPNSRAPFLSKGKEPREYEGVLGERLRTISLRGQVSQGLLFPMSALTNFGTDLAEGTDVSAELGIIKWEAPIPAQLAGEIVGLFPSFIRKTDQERIQNLTEEFKEWQSEAVDWEVTEKMDGSSMTVFVMYDTTQAKSGVCSRNMWLKGSEHNTYWKVATREKLIDKILSTNRSLAFQGELCGEGIQGNPYKLSGQDFFLYDIFDIGRQCYFTPFERRELAQFLGVRQVPMIDSHRSLVGTTVEQVLASADGPSTFKSAIREGFVYKCNQKSVSFKAVSNSFLLAGS